MKRNHRQRGVSLVELVIGTVLAGGMISVISAVFGTAVRSYRNTDARLDMAEDCGLAMRKISQELRSAINVTITNSGRTITYKLPKRATTLDPVTNEYEYLYPVVGEDVTRSLYYSTGRLMYNDGVRTVILAKNIANVDPDPSSSLYNQTYPIFSFSTVGGVNGVTVLLITSRTNTPKPQYVRLSSTIVRRIT